MGGALDNFDNEAKLVLQTIVDKWDGTDEELNNGYIEVARMPEILDSLVKHYDSEELIELIDMKDPDATGKLDLTKASQIIIYFLKRQAEREKEVFLRVTLKITARLCISEDLAMILLSFYPKIIKADDEVTKPGEQNVVHTIKLGGGGSGGDQGAAGSV